MRRQILWTILALCTGLMLAQGGISGTGQISVTNVPTVILYGVPFRVSAAVDLTGVTGSATVGLGGFVVPMGFNSTQYMFSTGKAGTLPGDPNANPPTMTFVNTDPAIANANGFAAVVGATSVDSVGPNYTVADLYGWPKDFGTFNFDLTSPAGAPAQVALSLSSKWTASNGGPANIPATASDATFTVNGILQAGAGDYTGDGLSDPMVYQPSTGVWFVRHQDGSYENTLWGTNEDTPVPGHYLGTPAIDITVYRPSMGVWFIHHTDGSYEAYLWGSPEDLPVPGSYLQAGRTDITVYRPSMGVWFIRHTDGTYEAYLWGTPEDVPVPGEYQTAGLTNIAVYRPSTGTWFILDNSFSTYTAFVWGAPGDIPVPGYYEVTGKTNGAVYRPSNQTWYIRMADGSLQAVQWGAAGDIPVPLQYTTAGMTNIAVYRPSTGEWIIRNPDGSPTSFTWGAADFIPVVK